MSNAAFRALRQGPRRYAVDVDTPELEPQFDVDVGTPQIEGPKYGVEVGAPHIDTPQYNVDVGTPKIEMPPKAKPNPAALAAMQSNDDSIRDHIAQKVTRSNVLGMKSDSLLGMDALAKAGVNTAPNEQGIAYGIDPTKLNRLELAWLTRKR